MDSEKLRKTPVVDVVDVVGVVGVVKEALPNALFRVTLEGRHEIVAHLSGDLQRNFIRILTGDRVEVRLSPFDVTRGRIVRRCQE